MDEYKLYECNIESAKQLMCDEYIIMPAAIYFYPTAVQPKTGYVFVSIA